MSEFTNALSVMLDWGILLMRYFSELTKHFDYKKCFLYKEWNPIHIVTLLQKGVSRLMSLYYKRLNYKVDILRFLMIDIS